MLWRAALMTFGIVGAGCVQLPPNQPLTPEEKGRIIDEMWEMEQLKQHAGAGLKSGCSSSTDLVRLQTRQSRGSNTDGFDSRGCTQGD